jgi:uncharacterized protein involved in outer membrane biogenesis
MIKSIITKIIVSILVVIVVVVTGVVILVDIFGDRALKLGIETAATKALNVGVSIEDVSLSILGGSVELEDLVINNPPGYQHEHLLEIGSAKIDVDIRSLMSDTVNIKSIMFDEVSLVIEQKDLIRTNNLQEILKSLGSGTEDKEPAEAEDKALGKQLHIDKLEVSNVNVKVKLLPLPGRADTITLKLDPIKMTNLGKDSNLDTAKLAGKVLAAIAAGVAKQGADILPEDLVGPIKSVFGESGKVFIETGKGLLDGGKDVGKGVTDALKGLFERKEDK